MNFDVPLVPDDYIHRVGRTARAEATGDAFTFVSPQEQGDLAQIERAIGKRLPRDDRARLRLQRPNGGAPRGPAGRAHRGHPEPQGGGTGEGES